MFETILIIVAFAGGVLLVIGGNLVIVDLFQRERKQMQDRLDEELRMQQREMARGSAIARKDLAQLSDEAWQEFGSGQRTFKEKIQDLIAQSGKPIELKQLAVWSISAAAGGGLLLGFLVGSIVLGVIGGLLAGAVPMLVVYAIKEKRLEMLRSQLPDVFDLMSRVLRAGQTMSQAMASVSDEFKAPVSLEFAYCVEQQNLGLAPEFALRDLARRTGLIEIKIFVLAMLVHRQTGGNLAELLDKLATIVRSRYRLRAKVKGLTAEGRMQGLILLALPVLIYVAMLFVNRPYAIKLLQLPALLIVSLTMMTLGALWIRKIVNFDF
jgi:tight adherence protein B